MKKYTPLTTQSHKFEIKDAVWYGEHIGRVEDIGVDAQGRLLYLVQLSNHRCHWVYEENLEVYIG